MEKYIQTMKNADQECRKIADRVQRFTRDLHEIDSGTIYAVAYRAVKREELIEAFSAEIVPMCEKAVKISRAPQTMQQTSLNTLTCPTLPTSPPPCRSSIAAGM